MLKEWGIETEPIWTEHGTMVVVGFGEETLCFRHLDGSPGPAVTYPAAARVSSMGF